MRLTDRIPRFPVVRLYLRRGAALVPCPPAHWRWCAGLEPAPPSGFREQRPGESVESFTQAARAAGVVVRVLGTCPPD